MTDRVALHRRMLEIRAFEDECQRLFTLNLVRGSTHLYQGQEAVAVGACAVLEPRDGMVCTYRGHGAVLARGAPLDRAMAEILGKAGGLCGGKGGSMHLTDVSVGALGSFATVGAQLPFALGIALTSQVSGHRGDRAGLHGRRLDEHRRLPRGHEHGRGLEAAAGGRRREQPLRRVLAARDHDRDHAARRPRHELRDPRRPGRRQRRRRGHRRRADGGRPGPRRRGADADRGTHLPPQGPQPHRSRELPARGRAGALAAARPDRPQRPRPGRLRRPRRGRRGAAARHGPGRVSGPWSTTS